MNINNLYKESKSIPQIIFSQINYEKNRPCIKYKTDNLKYKTHTWNDLKTFILKLSYYLNNIIDENSSENNIAILSENRPEWIFSDLACLSLNLKDVPIYDTSTPYQIKYCLEFASVKNIFVSNIEQAKKILTILPHFKDFNKIICFDKFDTSELKTVYKDSVSKIVFLNDILNENINIEDWEKELNLKISKIKKDDIATIIFTSGTTNDPKGVMLSHGNFIANLEAIYAHLNSSISSNDQTLSILPLSHVLERCAYYFLLSCGGNIAFAEDANSILKNLQEINPSIMICVPRLFEKIHQRILDTVYRGSLIKRAIFYWCLNNSKNYYSKIEKQEKVSKYLKLKYKLSDLLVFKKIRKKFGKNIRFFVSGGATLQTPIYYFFKYVGINILEGYGITEASPVVSANLIHKTKAGTVGTVLHNVECRINPDGEILIKGASVFKGYYKNLKASKEAFDEDNWFFTGDLGSFDEDSFLKIIGRKKEILVTSTGKNVNPNSLETLLVSSKFIAQACVVGDNKNYLTALIVPNFQTISTYADTHSFIYTSSQELVTHPRIIELISNDIAKINKELARFEQIKDFKILSSEFLQEKEEITPTLKIKRRVIYKNFEKEIESMYKN